jgi:hypothetical protein
LFGERVLTRYVLVEARSRERFERIKSGVNKGVKGYSREREKKGKGKRKREKKRDAGC